MVKYIYGADTETIAGHPMTLQFYSEDVACDQIHFVKDDTAANVFFKWCDGLKRDAQHVVYIHNLQFDLPELLWGHHAKLVGPGGDFSFTVGKWNVSGVYGTPTFCRLTNGHNRQIILVDSFSYFRGSLAKAAELFCPDLPKLRRLDGLGTKRFTKRDALFVDYAMRDAVVTYHMGVQIERLHKEFDLQQCVSVADMAARIFRHRYLDYTIWQPSREIIQASVLSYHGGKNNVTESAGWYEGITSLDLSSAYPDALQEMPAFSNAKLYKRYTAKRGTREVPDYGVYEVAGRLEQCKWPVLFSHGFKPLSGDVDGVFVQGFELNEALRSGEFKATRIRGHYYDQEKDHQAPALRNFVDDFYKRKENATDRILRTMYKFILNSISGKLIQTRKRGTCAFTDIDAGVTTTASELVAGGLFHPFIASATTAHTRARIHRLEHKHAAIHTATDGIFTQSVRAKAEGKGLGAITCEAANATLLMLRNKCYILYGKKSTKTMPSKHFKGKHILKYALHGFQGSVYDLERLASTGRRKYTVSKPNRLKESLKRGLTVNDFVTREYTLKIGPLKVRG